jgi:hypothetical protein
MRSNKLPSARPAWLTATTLPLPLPALTLQKKDFTEATDDAEVQFGPTGKLVMQGDIFQSWNISFPLIMKLWS